MRRLFSSPTRVRPTHLALLAIAAGALVMAIASRADLPDSPVTQEQLNDPKWLAGNTGDSQAFQAGEFITRPRNLTPHNTMGLGRYTSRQVFNALRYGLRPSETPDVVITASTPGEGNSPAEPHYLAPFMPWPSWRHMPDQDLWDIIAYLKHGIKPVRKKVKDNMGPRTFWAREATPEKIGPYPAPPYPAGNEEFRP